MAEQDDEQPASGLSHSEDLQFQQDTARALPAITVPMFALFLVGVCIFMAFIMFGSGNIVGGLIFSLIGLPLALFLRNQIRDWRQARAAQAGQFNANVESSARERYDGDR